MINAELLKNEINNMGVKQSVLAEKCGVTRQTISNWLNNTEPISAIQARALADALKIDEPDKLLAIFFAPNVENKSTE